MKKKIELCRPYNHLVHYIDALMDMICMIVTWIHNNNYLDLTQPSRLPTTFESTHDLAQPFGERFDTLMSLLSV